MFPPLCVHSVRQQRGVITRARDVLCLAITALGLRLSRLISRNNLSIFEQHVLSGLLLPPFCFRKYPTAEHPLFLRFPFAPFRRLTDCRTKRINQSDIRTDKRIENGQLSPAAIFFSRIRTTPADAPRPSVPAKTPELYIPPNIIYPFALLSASSVIPPPV